MCIHIYIYIYIYIYTLYMLGPATPRAAPSSRRRPAAAAPR